MNKKYWTFAGRSETTFYIVTDATNAWDTTGIKQRIDAIDPDKDIQSELSQLFSRTIGFEITVTPPTDGNHVGNL